MTRSQSRWILDSPEKMIIVYSTYGIYSTNIFHIQYIPIVLSKEVSCLPSNLNLTHRLGPTPFSGIQFHRASEQVGHNLFDVQHFFTPGCQTCGVGDTVDPITTIVSKINRAFIFEDQRLLLFTLQCKNGTCSAFRGPNLNLHCIDGLYHKG